MRVISYSSYDPDVHRGPAGLRFKKNWPRSLILGGTLVRDLQVQGEVVLYFCFPPKVIDFACISCFFATSPCSQGVSRLFAEPKAKFYHCRRKLEWRTSARAFRKEQITWAYAFASFSLIDHYYFRVLTILGCSILQSLSWWNNTWLLWRRLVP